MWAVMSFRILHILIMLQCRPLQLQVLVDIRCIVKKKKKNTVKFTKNQGVVITSYQFIEDITVIIVNSKL